MADVNNDYLSLITERKRESGQEVVTEAKTFDDDLLLDDEDVAHAATREQDEVDRILSGIDIIEAYNRWCDKGMVEGKGRKTEGLKVRCPNPQHPDNDPSAWLNTEKNLWACGGCGHRGGDIYDIAAWHFGYSVPSYKAEFHNLKQQMAEDLGYVTKKSPSGTSYLEKVETETDDVAPEPEPEPQPTVEGSGATKLIGGLRSHLGASPEVVERTAPSAKTEQNKPSNPTTPEPSNVISITPREEDPDFKPVTPSLNWPDLMVPGTFMDEWMKASRTDDLPEEYYFWLGLTGVGLAVGNVLALGDNPPVKGNLFTVLYGPSGVGKSRSINALTDVLRRAFPSTEPGDGGVYLAPSPGSAEALIDSFAPFAEDEDGNRSTIPVKGLVRFDELSTLMGRADRAGSAMKPTLMEFYDSYNPVTHKTRGHGEVTAMNHYASCLTTTQPRAIRDLLTQTDADAGFVNRWVFATGTPKELISFGRESLNYSKAVPLLEEINKWASDLHVMSGSKWRKNGSGKSFTPLGMDPDAFELWDEFFHDELVPNKLDENNAILSRSDLTLKKVMTLFAYDRQHENVELIDIQHTIQVWTYLERTYRGLSREIGAGVFEDCRKFIGDTIKGHMQRSKRKPSSLDILNASDGRYNAALIRNVLETMVSLGEIEEVLVEDKNGKRTPRYTYAEQ